MMNLAPSAALALCLVLPTSQAYKVVPVRAETALPATTFASVHFAGLGACQEQGGELGLIKLVERLLPEFDPAMLPAEANQQAAQAVREIEMAIQQMDQQLAQVGMDRAKVAALLNGPMALGLSRMTFMDGEIVPSMAMVMDVSADHAAAEHVVQLALGAILQEAGEWVDYEAEDLGGTELHLFMPKGQDGSIGMALTDRYLILSNSAGYARDCIRTAHGELASLIDDAGLEHARSRLGDDELLSVYLNTGLLSGWIEMFLPYEVDAVTDALGCRDIDGIYLAIGAGDSRSKEVLHLGVRGPETGLIRSLLAPASHRAAAMCPKDTVLYATSGVDPKGMLQAVHRVIESLPRSLQKEIMSAVNEGSHELEEVHQALALFGPEITIAVPMIGAQGMIPQSLVFIDSGRPEKAMKMILGMVEQQGMEIKTARFRDGEIHYTSIPTAIGQLSPAMIAHDGMVILASDLRALKAAIGRGEQNRRNLTSSESFVATMEEHKGATKLATLRFGDNISQIWGTLLPFLERQLEKQDQLQLPPEILPDEDELREILSDVVLTLTADDSGIAFRAEEPIGLGMVLASAGHALNWFLTTEDVDLSVFKGSLTAANGNKKIY
ncbi:MAG: hypothetical protein ACYTG5_00970 [Planctomycetota bacterium]|jgi:hypothetical protein